MVSVKICGINDPAALKAAVKAGANYIGLVFYPSSPRYVDISMAQALSGLTPDNVGVIGVFVNPSDEEVLTASKGAYLDYIQLHGDETPERIAEIKQLTSLPVIKAFRVAQEQDLSSLSKYEKVADWLLFDARISSGEYGGTGHSFDWGLLAEKEMHLPWILSGGINLDNVSEALEQLTPDIIDLSSGVESSPGKKDPEKIKAFFDKLKASGKFRPAYLQKI